MSVRLAVAGHAIVDEGLAAQVARYDTAAFPETQRAALAYADDQMMYPSRVDGTDLHRLFTRAQIVELTLDLVAWNKQKVRVALGVDRAVDEHALTPLTVDAEGHTHMG